MSSTLRKCGPGPAVAVQLAPAIVFLAFFFLYPVLRIFWMSISEPSLGFESYRAVLFDPVYFRVLGRTFWVALVVTVICVVLAFPLAYITVKAPVFGGFILAILALSFWTSYLVKAYAWIVMLGSRGPISQTLDWIGVYEKPKLLYSSLGMYIGLVQALLPYMALTIYSVMRRIDPQLVRAALNLGATPLRAFLSVFLPLSVPGIANGCTLVFVFCLGFYVTPALLGGPGDLMVPGLIAQEINQTMEWGQAGAMTMILIISTTLILGLHARAFGFQHGWN